MYTFIRYYLVLEKCNDLIKFMKKENLWIIFSSKYWTKSGLEQVRYWL